MMSCNGIMKKLKSELGGYSMVGGVKHTQYENHIDFP